MAGGVGEWSWSCNFLMMSLTELKMTLEIGQPLG
jgi:hypothetical protein